MILKVTSKRQVTFPKRVMESLHIKEGDVLIVSETEEGILIRPRRFDAELLAPLLGKIKPELSSPDFDKTRHAAIKPELRS